MTSIASPPIPPNPSQSSLTFTQFLEQIPEEAGRYELVNGEIMKILATRKHENVADFILSRFDREIEKRHLNYRVSSRIMVRTFTPQGQEQGRHPDVSVVDKTVWEKNLLSYAALTEPLALVVEVVSTNWEDDYIDKLDEYQKLGIPEYWIVDYLALGSRTYLGNPKEPTVLVYLLAENSLYESTAYRGSAIIKSRLFPELELRVIDIINA